MMIIVKSIDEYYEHIPKSVTTVNGTIILWAVPISTDRRILANRPDIVKDKGKVTPLQAWLWPREG
jgi:ABC-type glycerol-3-phosphate transport system substrate-binding protein